MIKPCDQSPDDALPPSGEELPLRKVVMLDPGFREELEASVLRPRILGMKTPSHPKDRRNIKFVAIALVGAALLFGVLECRQLREVEHDAKSPSHGAVQSK